MNKEKVCGIGIIRKKVEVILDSAQENDELAGY